MHSSLNGVSNGSNRSNTIRSNSRMQLPVCQVLAHSPRRAHLCNPVLIVVQLVALPLALLPFIRTLLTALISPSSPLHTRTKRSLLLCTLSLLNLQRLLVTDILPLFPSTRTQRRTVTMLRIGPVHMLQEIR